MSLGVPGTTLDQGWNDIYSRLDIALLSSNTIFVHAAGNDGLAQTQDIQWNFLTDPNMLIVGSVGPSGRISSFSNTPGTACLLDGVACKPGNRLMDRFLVAPGEWILVTDGEGGVRRASGTSFAAPIVTGAIALMQDRWGWMKSNPEEIIEILLTTATDLGEEGVDEVYGHGLINIAASQSPLDYKMLYQRGEDKNGNVTKNYLASLDTNKVETLLGASDGYITAFEDVGDTYRDFLIPLDEFLSGTVESATGELEQLQTFLTDDFASWSVSIGGVGISSKGKKSGGLFLDSQQIANPMGWDLKLVSVEAMPLTQRGSGSEAPYATSLSITSQSNVTFNFGNGMGAKALNGQDMVATASFDPVLGGANPVLGLASGGTFASVDMPVFGEATLSFGATERSYEGVYNDPFSGEELRLHDTVLPYRSAAANVSLHQPVGDNLSLNAGYTYLQERDGVLGVQSTNPSAFSDGARTDAVSVGMEWGISQRISLSGTATLGRTRGQSNDVQMLSVNEDGITTSAFEAAIDVSGVFGKYDAARIALVQPMYIEAGGLDMNSVEVVDRSTGDLSMVTRFTPTDNQAREMALEAFYGVPVMKGRAQIAGFVRAELAAADGVQEKSNHMIGGSFALGF